MYHRTAAGQMDPAKRLSLLDAGAFGARHYLAACLLAMVCLLPAVSVAHRAVHHLTQPYDLDQYRDAAAAQSIRDGRFPADPAYVGETIWYNPLLPAAIAAVSRVTGLDVAAASVEMGPFLNALAPIAFFWMAAALVGPWSALVAFACLLYASAPGDPSWATPAYSPWLFAVTFASTLFYGELLLYRFAAGRQVGRWAIAGVGLGLTFLAHTAPALILGLCAFSLAVYDSDQRGERARTVKMASLRLATLFIVAAIVSAPFLWSIVGHYGLRIVNRAPNDWVWPPIASWRTVAAGAVTIRNAIAALGLVLVGRRARADIGAQLLVAWFAAALLLFCYGYVERAVAPRLFPPLLPQYHFYFYLRSVNAVLTGVGVTGIVLAALHLLRRVLPRARAQAQMAAASLAAAAVIISVLGFDGFRNGRALTEDPFVARQLTETELESHLIERLRHQTPETAVVLATPEEGLRHVTVADRAVVALPAPFSNPYVAFEPRANALEQLMSLLMARDEVRFLRVARMYSVTHVLLDPRQLFTLERSGPPPAFLEELSRDGHYALFAIRQ